MPLELDSPSAAAPSTAKPALSFKLPRRKEAGAAERQFFTEQLALLLETGTSLHTALLTLAQQTDNPALGTLIVTLAEDIAEGHTFSRALARHPQLFPKSYVALVAASEQGGYLHKVLEQLVDLEERRARLLRALFSSLSYPVFLVLFSLAVVLFVLLVVFPKFSEMFAAIHNQLPLSTRLLMAASQGLIQYWYLVIAGAVAMVFATITWARSPAGRATLDRAKLTVPLARDVFVPLYFTQVLRVMGLSLANGVPITQALDASREIIANHHFRALLDRVEASIQQGAGIAAGFEAEAFVPRIVKQMIATGEATGNLARVMARVADHYERELDRRLATLSKMAEPVMLLVMGLVVGLIVSSLILPIFKLSRAVG